MDPNHKSKIKKVFYVVIVLVVVIALALVYVNYRKPKVGERGELTEEQKLQILAELSKQSGPEISDEDKLKILESLGEVAPKEELTDEQKLEILKQLNQ